MTRSPSAGDGDFSGKGGKVSPRQGSWAHLSNILFPNKLDIREIGGIERKTKMCQPSQAKSHLACCSQHGSEGRASRLRREDSEGLAEKVFTVQVLHCRESDFVIKQTVRWTTHNLDGLAAVTEILDRQVRLVLCDQSQAALDPQRSELRGLGSVSSNAFNLPSERSAFN